MPGLKTFHCNKCWLWCYHTVMEMIIACCSYPWLSYTLYGLQPHVASSFSLWITPSLQHKLCYIKSTSSAGKGVKLCKTNLIGINMGSSFKKSYFANAKQETSWIDRGIDNWCDCSPKKLSVSNQNFSKHICTNHHQKLM